jgi:hypothetical protein
MSSLHITPFLHSVFKESKVVASNNIIHQIKGKKTLFPQLVIIIVFCSGHVHSDEGEPMSFVFYVLQK